MKLLLLKLWRLLPYSFWLRSRLVWMVTQKFLVGVVGLILNEENEVLLLHHSYRKEYPWGLPSGWIKKGEQPQDAIRREILEEIGVNVRVLKTLKVENDSKWARLEFIFLCEVVDGKIRPSAEVTKAAYFPVDKLPGLLPSQRKFILETVELLSSGPTEQAGDSL
jgi:8-oxo-dGTP diphosphatase